VRGARDPPWYESWATDGIAPRASGQCVPKRTPLVCVVSASLKRVWTNGNSSSNSNQAALPPYVVGNPLLAYIVLYKSVPRNQIVFRYACRVSDLRICARGVYCGTLAMAPPSQVGRSVDRGGEFTSAVDPAVSGWD
jgi:hypothetical protein